MQKKTIFFDIGNVLLFFDHEKMFQQIAQICALPCAEVKHLFLEQGIALQYEKGFLSSKGLYKLLSDLANTKIQYEHLYQATAEIFMPNEAIFSILKELKKYHQLIILSNTCEIHFEFIKRNYTFLSFFDHYLLSYEIGFAKPEPMIYIEALKLAEKQLNECLYIDDLLDNVIAARQIGLESHQYQSIPHLIDFLQDKEALPKNAACLN